MAQTRIVISLPHQEERLKWKSLADVKKSTGWGETELLEIVQRYCDQHEAQKDYRTRKNQEFKALRKAVADGLLVPVKAAVEAPSKRE